MIGYETIFKKIKIINNTLILNQAKLLRVSISIVHMPLYNNRESFKITSSELKTLELDTLNPDRLI